MYYVCNVITSVYVCVYIYIYIYIYIYVCVCVCVCAHVGLYNDLTARVCKYTTGQKFWTVRFLMFFKEVSSAHQACIYLIRSTEKNSKFFKYFYYLK